MPIVFHDELSPLDMAYPYLVEALYIEFERVARLLVTTPGESPSLKDLDNISYLITTLADFRKHLQQGSSQEQSYVHSPL